MTKPPRVHIRHPGDLTGLGYHPDRAASTRRRALRRAVKEFGYASVIRKLNVIRNFTKRSQPGNSDTYAADMHFLQRAHTRRRARAA